MTELEIVRQKLEMALTALRLIEAGPDDEAFRQSGDAWSAGVAMSALCAIEELDG